MFGTIMSSVRNDLKLIYDKSVEAVKPNSLIKNFIELKGNELLIKNISQNVEKSFSLRNKDIYILGAGKAVLQMCEQFLNQFDVFISNSADNQKPSIVSGLLSVPIGSTTKSSLFCKYGVRYERGALHNMPDFKSMQTTQEIIDIIKVCKQSKIQSPNRDQLIICFISGGGSALLSLPKPGITLEDKCELISRLVKSGATIDQLNTVRSCLSSVKFGKLANIAINEPNSVQMISFLISDIINDPIHLIGSGPTVIPKEDSLRPSEKALKILNDFNIDITNELKNVIITEDIEIVCSDCKQLLNNFIIGNNSVALKTAQNTAQHLGYKVIYLGNTISGEASLVAQKWVETAIQYKHNDQELMNFKGICWVGGGETTVNMTDSIIGLGGRCQEMGLSFYRTVNKNSIKGLYMLCAGTDGQDGPTDVAGVITECILSNEEIWKQSETDLKTHNSYEFFKRYYSDWFVKTGITGTNVMDIYCLIKNFH